MTLLLDPDIRDWVVLPLFVIMVTAGLLRHYVGMLLQGEKIKANAIYQRGSNLYRQTSRIRSGSAANHLSTWKWYVRKLHYIKLLEEEAAWCEKEEENRAREAEESGEGADGDSDDPMAGMMNPMSMMKGNMAFMVQNMIMMQGIQHFFSGFILLKVPFPLTAGFKNMFQRGLQELPDLEPSYVSSVSWYFLVMYGLRAFYRLVIGNPPLELREQDAQLAQRGMVNPSPNPSQKQNGPEAAKLLRQEAENLELFMQNHRSELDSVEKRLLGKKRYPKRAQLQQQGGGKGGAAADLLLMGGTTRGGGGKSKKKQQ